VQDRAAQTIAPLLEAQPGERILDACAAPGGKSTHIAELIGDVGTVVAVDRSSGRLQRVRDNAERLGLQTIQPFQGDAATLGADPGAEVWADLGGAPFDRVLLDAPCSGLGTLARHADARWRLTPASIDALVELQQSLLAGVATLLRPGGRLVYATCTVHPRENQQQIAAFLEAHPGWQLRFEQQLWPRPQGGDGFYAAVLEAP
jgi:16S rRNA (cytosine967-C5)-methyltransferase